MADTTQRSSIYDTFDDPTDKPIIKCFTRRIRNILSKYEIFHHIPKCDATSSLIKEIHKILHPIDGIEERIEVRSSPPK